MEEDIQMTATNRLTILPQKWTSKVERMPMDWFDEHAPNLVRKLPEIAKWTEEIARNVGVSWKMIPVRIELEQSAISYPWDGSTKQYEGGKKGEETKLKYLCGADKTDSGPRENGWFGPRRQLLAYVLRFKYWYRGIDPKSENWKNWLGLDEDPKFKPGVPVTRKGITIIPANQISADCLRYTSGMDAQIRLSNIARKWWPNDFK